jgi:threonine synthase
VDRILTGSLRLSSANSINVGRLLPQMVYYAKASLELAKRDARPPNFIIPTGNLGNALACVWAREVGLPIGEIVLASNANLTVPQFLASGEWRPRPSIATLASAMDVGNPSNMERLRWLFPDHHALRTKVEAQAVSDYDIVEPLIGAEVPVPPALAELLALPSRQVEVEPGLESLRVALLEAA